MNKEVNFEIAKLLEEKGFNNESSHYYNEEGKYLFDMDFPALQPTKPDKYFDAPTIVEVVMWLYEKHEIFIQLFPIGEDSKMKFYSKIIVNDNGWVKIIHQISSIVNSPTEAYEAAIKYVLEKLI